MKFIFFYLIKKFILLNVLKYIFKWCFVFFWICSNLVSVLSFYGIHLFTSWTKCKLSLQWKWWGANDSTVVQFTLYWVHKPEVSHRQFIMVFWETFYKVIGSVNTFIINFPVLMYIPYLSNQAYSNIFIFYFHFQDYLEQMLGSTFSSKGWAIRVLLFFLIF